MSSRKIKRRRISAPPGHFDLVVIGSGGGNDETNLSGYLCKPRDQPWDAGILGLEAGSGYGALKRLLSTSHPHLFAALAPDSTPTDRAYAVYTQLRAYLLTHAHLDHVASLIISAGALPGRTKQILGAQGVLDDLHRCIFSPGRCWPNIVNWEGGQGGKLRALPVSDEYSELGIGMDDVRVRVVPVSHGGSCANEHEQGIYRSSAFFVRHVPTQHEFLFFGDVEADPDPDVSAPSPPHSTPPLSPATTGDSLSVDPPCSAPLDAAPDQINTESPNGIHPCRPLLLPIWRDAARLFTSSNLHTILLECSWPAGRPVAQLFGHLGVEHVRKEMRVLAREVVKIRQSQRFSVPVTKPRSSRAKSASPPPPPTTRSLKRKATHLSLQPTIPSPSPDSLKDVLKGLRVVVIHCKEPSPGFDLAGAPTIADYIVRQLNQGVPGTDLGPNELGVEYVAAHQGDEFVL